LTKYDKEVIIGLKILILEKRKKIGLTQERLADSIGTSKSTISDIERGAHEPGIWTAIKIARSLKCKVEEIFIL